MNSTAFATKENISGTTEFKWIGEQPDSSKDVALLIPQFNESTNSNMQSRLDYFKQVMCRNKDKLDVILIDDGSSDNSLDLIQTYLDINPKAFYLASVYPNGNKVGALYMTTLRIKHDLVILSDFDTDIVGLNKEFSSIIELKNDVNLMGCFFRMIPFEGGGVLFLWQQLEYAMARSLYKFHLKDKSVPVMPGAGSCFKRKVLNSIYHNHSGWRNGEDREATLIGLKYGYSTIYMNQVLALTRPPQTIRDLIKQRVRWNLGYLETFWKEKQYYCNQIFRLKRIGLRTLSDIFIVLFIVSLPFTTLVLAFFDVSQLILISSIIYLVCIIWFYYLLIISPKEIVEFKSKIIPAIIFYPIIKIVVEYFAWCGALLNFCKNFARS